MRLMKMREFNDRLNNINEPEVGDYVILYIRLKDNFYDFIGTHIGKLVSTHDWNNMQLIYEFEYENIPDELLNNFYTVNGITNRVDFARGAIKYWSKDKEELEMILSANKYNI